MPTTALASRALLFGWVAQWSEKACFFMSKQALMLQTYRRSGGKYDKVATMRGSGHLESMKPNAFRLG
ncbi:MAG: hypothetical protein B6242_03660 [Anaerolineaceae bacterium 4572_78]|nr:MAG: hypothetical protein B6242_03660 [Anaerolineaceae bacterium 4572_78]